MIKQAEWIAGLELTEKERESAAKEVQKSLGSFQQLRKVNVGYDVPPALAFVPAPGLRPTPEAGRNQARPYASPSPSPPRPESDEAVAFLSLAELSALIRSRKVELDRADEAVPRPAQAVRPVIEVRGDAHRGAGPPAG